MDGQIISYFNRLLSVLVLFLWSFFPQPKIVTPSRPLENTTPTSATISIPRQPAPNVPWGQTEKLGPGLYRTYVGQDEKMGSPDEILTSLNAYRKTHGVGQLRSDENLCKLAEMRADQQEKIGTLDSHKGLIDYMNDPNHWKDLDIKAIGENASYGYILSGTHLIEWVFDSDPEHRENQLNPSWNPACAGISGVTVDIVFGRR